MTTLSDMLHIPAYSVRVAKIMYRGRGWAAEWQAEDDCLTPCLAPPDGHRADELIPVSVEVSIPFNKLPANALACSKPSSVIPKG